MRTRDITDIAVVRAVVDQDATRRTGAYRSCWRIIVEDLRAPGKVAAGAMQRAQRHGLIEICSIPTSAFLTQNGMIVAGLIAAE